MIEKSSVIEMSDDAGPYDLCSIYILGNLNWVFSSFFYLFTFFHPQIVIFLLQSTVHLCVSTSLDIIE